MNENESGYISISSNKRYVLISACSSLLAAAIVIPVFTVDAVREALAAFLTLGGMIDATMSVMISIIVVAPPLVNLIGFLVHSIGGTKTGSDGIGGYAVSLLVFRALDGGILFAAVALFLMTGGPLFLMPFALVPMVIQTLVFAVMRSPVNKAVHYMKSRQTKSDVGQSRSFPSFKRGLKRMFLLMISVGFIEMALYFIFWTVLQIDLNSYEAIPVIFYTFCLSVFCLYIVLLLPVMYAYRLFKKASNSVQSRENDNTTGQT